MDNVFANSHLLPAARVNTILFSQRGQLFVLLIRSFQFLSVEILILLVRKHMIWLYGLNLKQTVSLTFFILFTRRLSVYLTYVMKPRGYFLFCFNFEVNYEMEYKHFVLSLLFDEYCIGSYGSIWHHKASVGCEFSLSLYLLSKHSTKLPIAQLRH